MPEWTSWGTISVVYNRRTAVNLQIYWPIFHTYVLQFWQCFGNDYRSRAQEQLVSVLSFQGHFITKSGLKKYICIYSKWTGKKSIWRLYCELVQQKDLFIEFLPKNIPRIHIPKRREQFKGILSRDFEVCVLVSLDRSHVSGACSLALNMLFSYRILCRVTAYCSYSSWSGLFEFLQLLS
jgi:hypothetical protein